MNWTAFLGLALFLCAGCVRASGGEERPGGSKAPATPPASVLKVAEAAAREAFGYQEIPYDVTLGQIDLSNLPRKLKKHWAFAALGTFKLPPARCVVLVSEARRGFTMPEGFGEVMVEEGLDPGTPRDFPAVIDLFAALLANGRVVARAEDIPWRRELGKDPAEYREKVFPPRLDASGTVKKGSFCTWTPAGGLLTGWEVQFEPRGVVTILKESRIDSRVGAFDVLQ